MRSTAGRFLVVAVLAAAAAIGGAGAQERAFTVRTGAPGADETVYEVLSWDGERPEEVLVTAADGSRGVLSVSEETWNSVEVEDLGTGPDGSTNLRLHVPVVDGLQTVEWSHLDRQTEGEFRFRTTTSPEQVVVGSWRGQRPQCLPCIIAWMLCVAAEERHVERCYERARDTCRGRANIKEFAASSRCGVNGSCSFSCW